MGEWTRRFISFTDRLWYYPAVSLLAGLDLFILIVPIDALFVPAVFVRPRSWFRGAIWLAIGSALGALLFAGILQSSHSEWMMQNLLGDVFQSPGWHQASDFVSKYGVWALAGISATVLPQQPAVVICALARMPLLEITLAFFGGRFLKYLVLGYIASHAPRLLMKIPFVRKEMETLAALAAPPPNKKD